MFRAHDARGRDRQTKGQTNMTHHHKDITPEHAKGPHKISLLDIINHVAANLADIQARMGWELDSTDYDDKRLGYNILLGYTECTDMMKQTMNTMGLRMDGIPEGPCHSLPNEAFKETWVHVAHDWKDTRRRILAVTHEIGEQYGNSEWEAQPYDIWALLGLSGDDDVDYNGGYVEMFVDVVNEYMVAKKGYEA